MLSNNQHNTDHSSGSKESAAKAPPNGKVKRVLVALLWPLVLAGSGIFGALLCASLIEDEVFAHPVLAAVAFAIYGAAIGLVVGLLLFVFRVSARKNLLFLLLVAVGFPPTLTYILYVAPRTSGVIVEAQITRRILREDLMESLAEEPLIYSYGGNKDVDPKELALYVDGMEGRFFELKVRRKWYLKTVHSLFSEQRDIASYEIPVGEDPTYWVLMTDSAFGGEVEPSEGWKRIAIRWENRGMSPPRSLGEFLYIPAASPWLSDMDSAP